MSAPVLTMSKHEFERAILLRKVHEKRLTQRKAAELLKLSLRQVERLCRSYREQGRVSKETLRQWMTEDGLWVPHARRRDRVHQPRRRRACLGELVQIDGCDHEWFEDRGQRCTLLVFVDDATSSLMQLLFCDAESTFNYFEAARGYLGKHGKPVAFYSDKAAVSAATSLSLRVATGSRNSDAHSPSSTSTSSAPTRPLRKAASSAPTSRCRTDWSRSSGCGLDRRGRQCLRSGVYGRLQRSLRQGTA
jgi:hypothetical protein